VRFDRGWTILCAPTIPSNESPTIVDEEVNVMPAWSASTQVATLAFRGVVDPGLRQDDVKTALTR